jgi:hypothetical protein
MVATFGVPHYQVERYFTGQSRCSLNLPQPNHCLPDPHRIDATGSVERGRSDDPPCTDRQMSALKLTPKLIPQLALVGAELGGDAHREVEETVIDGPDLNP